jgi:hypothetical protein
MMRIIVFNVAGVMMMMMMMMMMMIIDRDDV